MMWFGMVLKGKVLENKRGEEDETKSFVLKEEYEEFEVLTVENHIFCFDIT